MLDNGRIYTGNGEENWMVIAGNIIREIGSHKLKWDGNRIDLRGALVLPGLQDAHIHVYSLGRFSSRLNLKNTSSIAELQGKLRVFASKTTDDWIIGGGWDQDEMEDERYPRKQDLDKVVANQPVLLYRGCNHIGVVNSKALEILQIGRTTPDPEGGKIDRDEGGEPTGILRENALSLVGPHINHLDATKRLEYFNIGLKECLQAGLTAVHTNDVKAWSSYKKLQEQDKLPIRVFLTIPFDEIDEDEAPQPDMKVGLLQCKRVKLFADGSLGAETAALREPYNNSTQSGILLQSPEKLEDMIRISHQRGYQLEVHAIGDKAAEVVIDGFEKVGIKKQDRGVITHCQVLGRDLVKRMATNGYIANIQPPFVPTDARWVETRLGETSRLNYAYAWKTLLDNQVPCSGGSDAPIESPDPLFGIFTAMFRPDHTGKTWRKKECLSFDEALALYTSGAAYAVGHEDKLGRLQPGYLADFVVVDPTLLENKQKFSQESIQQVWVDGQLRFSQ